MKKVSTLLGLIFFAFTGTVAQGTDADKSYTLTRNRVIYLTCDTITIDPAFPDDTLYWNASMLQNPFNDAGMALNGMDATDWNYQVAFRQDYKDPETLCENVCSPGGSTIEGVKLLREEGMQDQVSRAIVASWRRNVELGK